MTEADDGENRSLYIYGRDVSKIPCFRESFLYGISGGIIAGFGTFMATSRPPFSMHVAMGIFSATTVCYWFSCRYNYSKYKFEYSKLQEAMKKQAIYEGTAREEEVRKDSEKVM